MMYNMNITHVCIIHKNTTDVKLILPFAMIWNYNLPQGLIILCMHITVLSPELLYCSCEHTLVEQSLNCIFLNL